MKRIFRRGFFLLFALCSAALLSNRTDAACNTIPSATRVFRGAVGALDHPFAAPDSVIELRNDPAICDVGHPGFSTNVADHVVTLVFKPPQGSVNVVVLATDCSAVEA